MRSPIWWYGGKGNMVKKLLPLFPKHHTYVEPFGGGASMLCAKQPSAVEVYNDLNSGLVGFFRVLRDPDLFPEFHRRVSLIPYSREEYYHCRETWEECDEPVERAVRWFVVARQSFSGIFSGSWSLSVTASARRIAHTISKWLSCIERLPEISARLLQVQIENNDFRQIFETYDTPDTFFYCDPPYVHGARSACEYEHEMTDADHADLVKILLRIRGMAILSGYPHEIYQPLEDAGWTRREWQTACYAAGRTRATGIQGKGAALATQPRTEVVWISPNALPSRGMFG